MTDHHPLRRRPAAAPATSTAVAVPADAGAAELEVRIRHAQQVAAARSALPEAYRQNPGAVMLAQEWAQARGIDLLTTLQTVSFVGGRPVIDATMQRALAKRSGYDVHVAVAADGQSATCTIGQGGTVLGEVTYTLDDARTAGLLAKDNWKKNPKAMLVARATAQAMRWHAPDVMVGVYAPEEIDDGTALDALEQQLQEQAAAVDGAAGGADDEPVEAEIVEDGEQPADEQPCSDETWQQLSDKLRDMDRNDREQLATWASARGWRLEQRSLTEGAALTLVAWEPR